MRLLLAVTCSIWLFLVPFAASALGLGEIELDSSLNQPFSAQIPLESLDESETAGLTVVLASRETFDRYGLGRPAYLDDFQFAVKTDSSGQSFIELTSLGPVSEPFVTLLLDVKWSSGRLLREYTVLLDPPLFEEQSVQQAVVPAQAAPAVTETTGEVARTAPAQAEVVAPTGLFQESAAIGTQEPAVTKSPEPVSKSSSTAVPASSPAAPAAPTSVSESGVYAAQKGDTLWRIAERTRGDSGISNNQMMLALYRANPEAFIGNINQLKAGSILRIPETAEILDVSPDQATSEVRQQHAAWSEKALGSESPRLELVAPDESAATGSQAGATVDAGLAGQSDQAAQLQGRLGDLESELAESQRLLQVRDAELLALQQRIAELEQTEAPADPAEVNLEAVEPTTDPAEIFAEDGVSADEESEAALPAEAISEATEDVAEDAPDSATVVSTTGEQPSFVSSLLGNIWFWAGAGLLLLAGLFVARRRSAETSEVDWNDAQDDFVAETQVGSTVLDDAVVGADDSDDVYTADFGAAAEDTQASDEDEPPFDSEPVAAPLEDLTESDAAEVGFDTIATHTGELAESLDEHVDELADPEVDVETPLEKTISTGAPLNLDQADPIAEAEFHMAYGLYDQAAELLTRALVDQPDNRAYRVKLIEVLFVWENKAGFLEQATLLHEAVNGESDSDWNKVLILGKQLCPDEALFAGDATSMPTADSMDLELTDAGDTELDFSLSGNEVKALDLELPEQDDDDLDVDFGVDFSAEADTDESGDFLTLNLDGELDNDAATMESPTIDAYGADSPTIEASVEDMGASTMETPTIESPMLDSADDAASTMETPTIESPMLDSGDDSASTMETPTLEAMGPEGATSEMPSLDFADFDLEDEVEAIDATADSEVVKDPTSLDIDLSGLAEFDDEDGSSTALENEADGTVEMPSESSDFGAIDSVEELADVDFNFDAEAEEPVGDTVEQPSVDVASGDTAEQPALSSDADLDFDLDSGSEVDTFTASDDAQAPDDSTMTEVGTKLDLARAYIDMGDPEGARSILGEVLDEGGESQQQEARQLLEELTD